MPTDPLVCDTSNISYNNTVVPILQNQCYGCHSGGTTNGGIDLSNYETVVFLAQNGTLSGVINHAEGYTNMPPFTKLNSCEIVQIEKWIDDSNFQPPDEGHPCDPDTVYFENEILPLIISSCATTDCHDKLTDEQEVLLVDYASIIEYGEIILCLPRQQCNTQLRASLCSIARFLILPLRLFLPYWIKMEQPCDP